jgi:diguanylate cyclase (GGDEF)-like protein/PAS domain S-box-containing protein
VLQTKFNGELRPPATGRGPWFSGLAIQLTLLFLLVLAAIWGGVHFQLRYVREQIVSAAERDRNNLARAFAEQVNASMRGIDLSLLSLREQWRHHRVGFHDAVQRQQNYFVRDVSFQVGVIDAEGQMVYSSLNPKAHSIALADREHFRVHRERSSDELFISRPLLGRLSGGWTIQFTRPIHDHAGHFLGVIVMSVAPEYFSRFYDTINLGDNGIVTLVRSTGEILARSPDGSKAVGTSLADRPFFASNRDTGNYQAKGKTDDVERIYTWRKMNDFGLIVIIGEDVDSLLAPYYLERRNFVAGAVLATALLGFFAILIAAGLRQRARVSAALERSEARSRLQVAALEAVGNGVVITDTSAVIEWVNPAFEALTGYCPSQVIGRRPSELIASGLQDPDFYKTLWDTITSGNTWRGELVNRRVDGTLYDEELVIAPVKEADGRISHFVGVKQDISERKRIEKALQQSHDLLAKLSRQVPGLIYQFRLFHDGRAAMPFASEAVIDMYGVTPEEVRDDVSDLLSHIHPADLVGISNSIEESAHKLTPWQQEYRVLLNGEVRWHFGSARPERLDDGSTLWHGCITDVTERRKSEEQLRVAAAAFELQEGMMVTDAASTILRVNRAFEQVTGYRAEEVIGKKPSVLRSDRQDSEFYQRMWSDIADNGSWQGEIWNRRKDGEVYPEWLVISAVKDNTGRITHYVGAFSDITQRKKAEAQIRDLAFYDPLTGLPNRRLLMDRTAHALAISARNKRYGALMLLDLDHFKKLNDTWGHDVGDQLLVQVAERLKGCVRERDTVARQGGDEFVILLEDLSLDEAAAIIQAETVGAKILDALDKPYPLRGMAGEGYRNTPSIGICCFLGHNEPVEVLLKHADIALYRAKDAGRNTMRLYNAAMQAELSEKSGIEAGLRNALAGDGFTLYYQPLISEARKIAGVEALLRWERPGHGPVLPARFLPVAEETDLILQIGHWVLEHACAQLVAWSRTAGMEHIVVGINISARQFRQPDFVRVVKSVLESSGANPERLKLELKEGAVLANMEDAIAKMTELRKLGVLVAIDDFGTAYASLTYLRRLPVDQIKIDQSFINGVDGDEGDAAIVRTIIDMSRLMEMEVVAGGVEKDAQHAFLREHRCNMFQGYLFGRPMPVGELENMVGSELTERAR